MTNRTNAVVVRIVKQDDKLITLELCVDNPVSQTVDVEHFKTIAIDNSDGTYTLDFDRLSKEDKLILDQLTEEFDTRIKWLIPYAPHILRAINVKDLHNMGMLGSIVQKYLDKFSDNVHDDFIADINFIRFRILGMEVDKKSG